MIERTIIKMGILNTEDVPVVYMDRSTFMAMVEEQLKVDTALNDWLNSHGYHSRQRAHDDWLDMNCEKCVGAIVFIDNEENEVAA